MSTHRNSAASVFFPLSEPHPSLASAGDHPILAGRFGPVSYEVTTLFPGSWWAWDLVWAPQEWSFFFPQSCGIPSVKPHWPSKPILWGFLLLLPDLQAGKPDVGLRTFTPVGELLWCNYFPVCGLPTRWVWDLILSWLCPSYHLVASFFVFGCMVSFLSGFSVFFVSGLSAVSHDFGVFVGRGELTSFYSVILPALQWRHKQHPMEDGAEANSAPVLEIVWCLPYVSLC